MVERIPFFSISVTLSASCLWICDGYVPPLLSGTQTCCCFCCLHRCFIHSLWSCTIFSMHAFIAFYLEPFSTICSEMQKEIELLFFIAMSCLWFPGRETQYYWLPGLYNFLNQSRVLCSKAVIIITSDFIEALCSTCVHNRNRYFFRSEHNCVDLTPTN